MLDDLERLELKSLMTRRKMAHAMAMRTRIVLACAEGQQNKEVAAKLGLALAMPREFQCVASFGMLFRVFTITASMRASSIVPTVGDYTASSPPAQRHLLHEIRRGSQGGRRPFAQRGDALPNRFGIRTWGNRIDGICRVQVWAQVILATKD